MCHTTRVGQSIKGIDVSNIKDGAKQYYGVVPEQILVDSVSEIIIKDFDQWAYENNAILDISKP